MSNSLQGNKSMHYYEKGLGFIQAGSFNEAINAFTSDINTYNNYGALENRAFAYAQIGDKNSALRDYKIAHERVLDKVLSFEDIEHPERKFCMIDLVTLQSYIGQLCLELGEFEDARTHYQTAILNCLRDNSLLTRNISLTLLYSNSAVANMRLQDYDEAARDFAGSIKYSNSEFEKQQIDMHIHFAGLTELVKMHLAKS
jgi:tetratricopeptide (TPR) repeat protein